MHAHVHTCTYLHTNILVCICTYIHVCTCIHAYIHTYIHTHHSLCAHSITHTVFGLFTMNTLDVLGEATNNDVSNPAYDALSNTKNEGKYIRFSMKYFLHFSEFAHSFRRV